MLSFDVPSGDKITFVNGASFCHRFCLTIEQVCRMLVVAKQRPVSNVGSEKPNAKVFSDPKGTTAKDRRRR